MYTRAHDHGPRARRQRHAQILPGDPATSGVIELELNRRRLARQRQAAPSSPEQWRAVSRWETKAIARAAAL